VWFVFLQTPPPIVDLGLMGPVRCNRCKAYICPYMTFLDGGRKFQCNFCGCHTEGKYPHPPSPPLSQPRPLPWTVVISSIHNIVIYQFSAFHKMVSSILFAYFLSGLSVTRKHSANPAMDITIA